MCVNIFEIILLNCTKTNTREYIEIANNLYRQLVHLRKRFTLNCLISETIYIYIYIYVVGQTVPLILVQKKQTFNSDLLNSAL